MRIPLLTFLTLISLSCIVAQPGLEFVEVLGGFTRPVSIANAGDNSKRLFIVDQPGYVYIVDSNGVQLPEPFLDISDKTVANNERGLLGLVFHPDYENNGFFFVNYTNVNEDTEVVRYKVSSTDPNLADTSSGALLMEVEQPLGNHNGGTMQFSPVDGYLYLGFGDGGGSGDPDCLGQKTQTFHGKILRIDVDQNVDTPPYYAVPPDNPFVDSAAIFDEIWSLGLRNPWKFSFDRLTGDLWIADVGQNEQEEVNFQPASSSGGENYGWKPMEGMFCYDPDPIDPDCPDGTLSCNDPAYTDPIFWYTHDEPEGGRSVTGGYVYRGCRYPELYGYYVVADFIRDHVWLLDSLGNDIFFDNMPGRITSFGEDENGEIYAVSLNQGKLFALRETTYPVEIVLTAADSPVSGTFEATETIVVESGVLFTPGDTVVFTAPEVIIADDLDVPKTVSIQVNARCGGE